MNGVRQVRVYSAYLTSHLRLVTIADRVQWFRARAQAQRWEEEVEILEEEFRRTIRSFERMAEVWRLLAKAPDMATGYSAYAFKHTQMFSEMAEDCRGKFAAQGGTWPDKCTLLELISQQRRDRNS
jgi:hypothetical protein